MLEGIEEGKRIKAHQENQSINSSSRIGDQDQEFRIWRVHSKIHWSVSHQNKWWKYCLHEIKDKSRLQRLSNLIAKIWRSKVTKESVLSNKKSKSVLHFVENKYNWILLGSIIFRYDFKSKHLLLNVEIKKKNVYSTNSSSFCGAGVHSSYVSEAAIIQHHTSIRLVHTPPPRRLNWTRQIKIIHGLGAPRRAVLSTRGNSSSNNTNNMVAHHQP